MGRRFAYKQDIATMTTGAGQVILNSQQTMSDRVCGVVISIQPDTGATNQDVGRIQRFQISGGGVPIVTFTLNQLRAYIRRFSKSNWVPPITGAGSDTLTIPFWFPDAPTDDEADACQWPEASPMQFTFQYGANGGSGSPATGTGRVMLSYIITDVEPQFFPVMLTSQMNIQPGPSATGTSPGVYPLVEPGNVRALLFPTTGIAEFRLQLNGKMQVQLPGPANLSCAANALREVGQLSDGPVGFEPLCFKTPFNQSAAYSQSFVAMDVNNAWAGAANELGIVAVRPRGAPLTSNV